MEETKKHSNGITSTQWTYDRRQTPYNVYRQSQLCSHDSMRTTTFSLLTIHFPPFATRTHTHTFENPKTARQIAKRAPKMHSERRPVWCLIPFRCPHFVFTIPMLWMADGAHFTSQRISLQFQSAYPYFFVAHQKSQMSPAFTNHPSGRHIKFVACVCSFSSAQRKTTNLKSCYAHSEENIILTRWK